MRGSEEETTAAASGKGAGKGGGHDGGRDGARGDGQGARALGPLDVPPALQALAAWLWRLLVIAAGVWVIAWLASKLLFVIVPVAIALALTALLKPPVDWLARHGWPRLGATWAVLLAFLLVFVAAGFYIVPSFLGQLDQIQSQVEQAITRGREWLVNGPLSLEPQQVTGLRDQITRLFPGGGTGAAAAIRGVRIALEALAALIFTLFLTFFFVKDGDEMVAWAVGQLDEKAQAQVRTMGTAAWETFSGFLRAAALVAAFNAVVSGIAYFAIGLPLFFALAIIEFIFSFVPLVGAFTAGLLAALVALATAGVTKALIVVGIAVVIEQLEENVFQPFVIGRTINLHPAMVGVVVAVGALLGGIVGALLAVPVASTLVAAIGALRESRNPGTTDAADLSVQPSRVPVQRALRGKRQRSSRRG